MGTCLFCGARNLIHQKVMFCCSIGQSRRLCPSTMYPKNQFPDWWSFLVEGCHHSWRHPISNGWLPLSKQPKTPWWVRHNHLITTSDLCCVGTSIGISTPGTGITTNSHPSTQIKVTQCIFTNMYLSNYPQRNIYHTWSVRVIEDCKQQAVDKNLEQWWAGVMMLIYVSATMIQLQVADWRI